MIRFPLNAFSAQPTAAAQADVATGSRRSPLDEGYAFSLPAFGEQSHNLHRPGSGRHALFSEAVFVPEHYERGYAYPLLVWLVDEPHNKYDIHSWMPAVSERNYFGLSCSVRPWLSQDPTQHVSEEKLAQLAEHLRKSVVQTRLSYHVHSERVVLVGHGATTSLALTLLLSRPEWFAGAALLHGDVPAHIPNLRQFRDLRGKSLFFSGIDASRGEHLLRLNNIARTLHAAGLDIESHAGPRSAKGLKHDARKLDQWLMRSLMGVSAVGA